MTRAAVYDRYWRSQGGGERHAGMVAQLLAEQLGAGRVDLLGHEETDLVELGEHLGLDLSGCRYRLLPDRGEHYVSEVTADYDFFLNATYMSRVVSKAARSAYLCFFPTPPDHDLAPWRKRIARTVGPHIDGHQADLEYGPGWYPPETARRRRGTNRTFVWMIGDAVLALPASPSRRLAFEVAVLRNPPVTEPVPLRLVDETGREHAQIGVTPRWTRHVVDLGASGTGTELRMLSPSFRQPATDMRQLGVAMSRMHLQGAHFGPRQRAAGRFPWLLRGVPDHGWLASYDTVIANSAYTAGWIERLWDGHGSDVLYPPIDAERLHPAPVREKAVVTVGRFFSPGLGHAKRQVEMVEAFGRLHMERRLPGWQLWVLGGCEQSQEPYLREVRRAAAGLPVRVVANAPRAEVELALSTASICWSATGLHTDEESAPWTAEHFGMTTVEGMAGGCVPIVIDRAGQKEIVREGVDGFRWSTVEELMDRTVAVAADEGLRARLAASAVERAAAYDTEAFRKRWAAIVASHDLLP